ncbi:MAG: DUF4443 domain-containing protein [Candidatus Methanosuratincola sp.]|uniref:Uncharacterized protein n=1 Tax=Methanosuratincola subterraneus TaxID=2593994 RepID=A0A3S3RF05_METS7|nr:MAG: hypothetical protein Metus_0635 [Candidatus Methanosuratincola subterraneus]
MSDPYSTFVQSLSKNVQPKGPAAAYTAVHVIKALIVIESSKSVGRVMLSRVLGIGEGSVRTIIKRLQQQSLISIDSIGGCALTSIGREVLGKVKKGMVSSCKVDLSGMGVGYPSYAIQISLDISAHSVLKLRDVAIKWGAEGAIVFNFSGGRIVVPSITDDLSQTSPSMHYELMNRFRLQEGDHVIATFAHDADSAEMSALAVFLFLKGIQ